MPKLDTEWYACLNYTERCKMSLARALIMNPEVALFQRPFQHYPDFHDKTLMKVFKKHCKNRGFCLPKDDIGFRRPRTLFFSPESTKQAAQADVAWQMDTERK